MYTLLHNKLTNALPVTLLLLLTMLYGCSGTESDIGVLNDDENITFLVADDDEGFSRGAYQTALQFPQYAIYSFNCATTRLYVANIVQTKQPDGTWKSSRAISFPGKNALDFHIAYYLGKKVSEPDAMHYILSKDKGYDPLVLSINKVAKNEIVKRIISLEDLKSHDIKEKVENADPNYTTLVNKINSMAKSKRPKSEKKLESFIKTQVFSKMEDSAIKKLIDELYRNKIISKGQNNRISY